MEPICPLWYTVWRTPLQELWFLLLYLILFWSPFIQFFIKFTVPFIVHLSGIHCSFSCLYTINWDKPATSDVDIFLPYYILKIRLYLTLFILGSTVFRLWTMPPTHITLHVKKLKATHHIPIFSHHLPNCQYIDASISASEDSGFSVPDYFCPAGYALWGLLLALKGRSGFYLFILPHKISLWLIYLVLIALDMSPPKAPNRCPSCPHACMISIFWFWIRLLSSGS